MLPTAEVVREVVGIIRSSKVPVVIVDPVLRSTSGFALANEEAIDALINELFPLATLVTPNLAEAQLLSGFDVKDDLQQAAEAILKLGSHAVLITGGDGDTNLAIDFLLDAQGAATFSAERISSTDTHGTGCTLASALACLLALGLSVRESVPIAKEYVRRAILSAPGLGQGNGPLNHFPDGCEIEY
jgi:hydroxymethylpyrimidine/phosphomethylpyrimidine kinase